MGSDYSRVELGAMGSKLTQDAYQNSLQGIDTSLYDPESVSYDAYQSYLSAEGLDQKLLWAIEQARDEGDLAYLNWYYGQASKAAQAFWSQAKLLQASTTPSPQAQDTMNQASQNRYLAGKSQQNAYPQSDMNAIPGLMQLLQQLGGPGMSQMRLGGLLSPNLLNRGGQQQAYQFYGPPLLSSMVNSNSKNKPWDILGGLGSNQMGAGSMGAPNLGAALRGYSGLI